VTRNFLRTISLKFFSVLKSPGLGSTQHTFRRVADDAAKAEAALFGSALQLLFVTSVYFLFVTSELGSDQLGSGARSEKSQECGSGSKLGSMKLQEEMEVEAKKYSTASTSLVVTLFFTLFWTV